MKWADKFFEEARTKGINCTITNRVNGWSETMVLHEKTFYVKSMTYNPSRGLYFQGVDPAKLRQKGDYVFLCGGIHTTLRDIFIIPWGVFFETLQQGTPVNTYKPPREYWQYKFYLRQKRGEWVMTVQGGSRPAVDISDWRHNSKDGVESLTHT